MCTFIPTQRSVPTSVETQCVSSSTHDAAETPAENCSYATATFWLPLSDHQIELATGFFNQFFPQRAEGRTDKYDDSLRAG